MKMKQFRVFYCNNVESTQVADFDTLEQAKQYCAEECKGYEPVRDGDTEYEHHASSKFYEVYDGDPRIFDEDGDLEDFKNPIYRTDCFYVN
jgi:hypothetical protein